MWVPVLAVLLGHLSVCLSMSSREEFPNPRKEWRMCGQTKPSFVCDPDFLLERWQAERLNQIAVELRSSTSCVCPRCSSSSSEFPDGITAAVFIAHNISTESLSRYSTGDELSEMLRRRWGLSTCDGDLVVVVITRLNLTGYSAGPSLNPLLPQDTASQILSQCSGHFTSGFFYQGLESVLNSVRDALVAGQHRITPSTFKNMMLGIGLGFGVLLLLAVIALALLHRQQVRRRKSNCSNIYPAQKHGHRPSLDREQHLEKLRHLKDDDSDEEESLDQLSDEGSQIARGWRRVYRQLSSVQEESGEEETRHGASFSSSSKGSVPVTEL